MFITSHLEVFMHVFEYIEIVGQQLPHVYLNVSVTVKRH